MPHTRRSITIVVDFVDQIQSVTEVMEEVYRMMSLTACSDTAQGRWKMSIYGGKGKASLGGHNEWISCDFCPAGCSALGRRRVVLR